MVRVSAPIDAAAMGRLHAHLAGYDRFEVKVSRRDGGVVWIEWWGDTAQRTPDGTPAAHLTDSGWALDPDPNAALAKVLAEIGDEGPCPSCGYPQERPAADERCETCRTCDEAARWQREIDVARGK